MARLFLFHISSYASSLSYFSYLFIHLFLISHLFIHLFLSKGQMYTPCTLCLCSITHHAPFACAASHMQLPNFRLQSSHNLWTRFTYRHIQQRDSTSTSSRTLEGDSCTSSRTIEGDACSSLRKFEEDVCASSRTIKGDTCASSRKIADNTCALVPGQRHFGKSRVGFSWSHSCVFLLLHDTHPQCSPCLARAALTHASGCPACMRRHASAFVSAICMHACVLVCAYVCDPQ